MNHNIPKNLLEINGSISKKNIERCLNLQVLFQHNYDEYKRRLKQLSKKNREDIQWLTEFLFQYVDEYVSLRILPTDLEAYRNTR